MDPTDEKKSNGPGGRAPGPGGGASRRDSALVVDGEVDKALAFPVLVEPIHPAGAGGVMTTSPGYSAGADIGAQVTSALRDVLGWQPRGNDAKGFIGALTQSFDLREVE